MIRYVHLDEFSRFTNLILWDGESPIDLPEGHSLTLEDAYVPLPHESSPYHTWSDATLQFEPDADKLQAAREAKWEEIKTYREAVRNSGGFKVANLYWFHSDTPSRFDQLGLVNAMLMGVLPATAWYLMDGTEVTLTAPIVQGVFAAHMHLRGTNFAVAKAHKTAVFASEDPLNYNYLGGGWVPIFGE